MKEHWFFVSWSEILHCYEENIVNQPKTVRPLCGYPEDALYLTPRTYDTFKRRKCKRCLRILGKKHVWHNHNS